MKTKTPLETLKAFKQLNKVAREGRAKRLGFVDAAACLAYLESQVKSTSASGQPKKATTKTKTAPPSASVKEAPSKGRKGKQPSVPVLIHVADVLDASGSMNGPKFINALKGINKGIEGLKCDASGAEYTYTLCDFSHDVLFPFVKRNLQGVHNYSGETRGSTSLYDAIGQTIRKIEANWIPGAKVLVNIYTDGQENSSKEFSGKEIAAMIKVLSGQGWTFTFVGTDHDVAYVVNNLHIHESNTLVYDGSAQGLEKSLSATVKSRGAYAQAAVRGEDVSVGFYKDLSNK